MDTQRRRRPALSCVECRRRKVKCDRSHPCKPCTTHSNTCSYKVYKFSSALPQPAIAPALSSQTIHTDRAIRLSTLPTPDSASSPQLPERGHPTQFSHPQAADDIATVIGPIPHGPSRPLADLKKTRLLKHSDSNGVLFGLAPEFSTIMACFTQAVRSAANPVAGRDMDPGLKTIGTLLQQVKQYSRHAKLSRPSRRLAPQPLYLELPERDRAEAMTDLYFDFFESAYRILHEATFRDECLASYDSMRSASVKQQLKLVLVSAIGSSVAANFLSRSVIEAWIHSAEAWLAGPLEKDRLDVSAVQIHCLTLLARQVNGIGSDMLWASSGGLLQRAMQIGMHRDPKHLPPMPQLAAEIRRRLWATIVELTLQDSLDAAMPARLTMEDFDTELPADVTDEELVQSHARPEDQRPPFLQRMLGRSFGLRLRIIRALANFRDKLTYSDTLELTSELMTEMQEVMANNDLTPSHRILLDFHVRRFLEPLNAPFAAKARESPLYHYSQTVVMETALALMTPEGDEAFARLLTVAGGMFRESIRCASTLLAMHLLSELQRNLREGNTKRDAARRAPWKEALQHMRAITRARVVRGETNVKNHMFLSMVLAEVNAREDGMDVEEAVMSAAEEALRECYDIIVGPTNNMDGIGADANIDLPGETECDDLVPLGWSWDVDLDDSLLMGDFGFI